MGGGDLAGLVARTVRNRHSSARRAIWISRLTHRSSTSVASGSCCSAWAKAGLAAICATSAEVGRAPARDPGIRVPVVIRCNSISTSPAMAGSTGASSATTGFCAISTDGSVVPAGSFWASSRVAAPEKAMQPRTTAKNRLIPLSAFPPILNRPGQLPDMLSFATQ